MERVYVYVWGQAYWLERPAGLIAKATGQRLTRDYITNPPRAAPLPIHAAAPNWDPLIMCARNSSQRPGMHVAKHSQLCWQMPKAGEGRGDPTTADSATPDAAGRARRQHLRSHVATCWRQLEQPEAEQRCSLGTKEFSLPSNWGGAHTVVCLLDSTADHRHRRSRRLPWFSNREPPQQVCVCL